MDTELPGSYFYGVHLVREYDLAKPGEYCPTGVDGALGNYSPASVIGNQNGAEAA